MVNKVTELTPELQLQLVEEKATYNDIGWEVYFLFPEVPCSVVEDFAEAARDTDIRLVMEAEIGRG